MTVFWLIAIGMLFVASVFVLVPVIRHKTDVSKSNQTSDWYRSREQELATEFSAGKYTEQEYQDAVIELKLTAKDELILLQKDDAKSDEGLAESKDKAIKTLSYKHYLLIATTMLILVVGVFYANKGLYSQLNNWEKTLVKMPELSKKVIQNLDSQVSETELREFALGLRSKLAVNEDHIGWMLLGRVLMSLQDIDGAVGAFEKSYNMEKNNVSNTVSFAQALQLKGDEFELKRSLKLLQEALILKPNNELAVILFGEGNFMLERFEPAKQGFEYALKLLNKTDPRVGAIEQRLSFINQQLMAKDGAQISLSIDISSQLKGKLSDFSYLFVFAKIDSMPMPMAVKKLPITQMPVTINLSDVDVMLPELKLSDYKTVNVYARLSVDENAPLEPGDWQGSLLNVTTSKPGLVNKIMINEEYK